MIDQAGSNAGTYSIVGNTVSLRFEGCQAYYTGALNGQVLAGTARNTQGASWSFSVNRT